MAPANCQKRFALAEYFINQKELAQVAFAAIRCGIDGLAKFSGKAILV